MQYGLGKVGSQSASPLATVISTCTTIAHVRKDLLEAIIPFYAISFGWLFFAISLAFQFFALVVVFFFRSIRRRLFKFVVAAAAAVAAAGLLWLVVGFFLLDGRIEMQCTAHTSIVRVYIKRYLFSQRSRLDCKSQKVHGQGDTTFKFAKEQP